MALTLIITNAGRQALVNAARDGTNAVRIASCGVSSAPTVPAVTATALPGEIKRVVTVSGDAIAANVIHLVVRDESADSYTLRSFGLYLQDGTLFAIYGQADPILEKSTQALLLLAVDAAFVDISAAQVTFGNTNFLNPPATTERPGVIELATDAEAAALADAVRALTPRSAAAFFTAANILARLLTVDGAGCGLDADMVDGRHANEFALLTGAPFTGAVAGPSFTAGGAQARLAMLDRTLPTDPTHGWYLYSEGDVLRFTATAIGAVRVSFTPAGGIDALGAIRQAGNQVWHVANDGAGSGMDADLLDGREAAEFALLTGAAYSGTVSAPSLTVAGTAGQLRLLDRTLPADNTHGWTIFSNGDTLRFFQSTELAERMMISASGVLDVVGAIRQAGNQVWHAGNDGAGSGLDADLLDGRQGSEFALLAGAAAFGGQLSAPTMAIGGPGGQLALRDRNIPADPTHGWVLYSQGDTLRFYQPTSSLDRATLTADGILDVVGAIRQAGNQVWHVGNDGSGSGLDADMLDGRHGAEFNRITVADLSGNLGYRVHADGMKECWGVAFVGPGATVVVNLPVAHTTWCVPTGNTIQPNAASPSLNLQSVNGNPPTSFTLKNNNGGEGATFIWNSRGV